MNVSISDIPTALLRELLRDIAQFERDGYIGDSYLLKLHAQSKHYTSISQTVSSVYREAALRWEKEHE